MCMGQTFLPKHQTDYVPVKLKRIYITNPECGIRETFDATIFFEYVHIRKMTPTNIEDKQNKYLCSQQYEYLNRFEQSLHSEKTIYTDI